MESLGSTVPRPASPEGCGYVRRAASRRVIAIDRPGRPLRWALYGFMFSLPFEAVPLGIPATPSKLFGFVLFLAALRQPRLCFGRRSAALIAFAAYTLLFTFRALPQLAPYPGETFGRLSMLWQLLILFWLTANVLRFQRVADRAFLCLGLGCGLLSGLLLLGIGKTTVAYYDLQRLTAFGWNPNELAALLGFGVVCLVGVAAKGAAPRRTVRVLLLPAFVVITAAIVQTGSRSGLIALVVGLLAFAFGKMRLVVRVGAVLLVGLGLATMVVLVMHSQTALFRWRVTLDRADVSQRDVLFTAAWEMFLEAPAWGWGPITNTYELASRAFSAAPEGPIDPHDLALSILTESGIAGGVLFLTGVLLCVQAAWRGRRRGALPLALTATLLVMCSSGVWQYRKPFWLVLGYAIAAGAGGRLVRGVPRRRSADGGGEIFRRRTEAALPGAGAGSGRAAEMHGPC